MERNFFRRVEVAFPITHLEHRERILRDLNAYLKDNCQAWLLRADGTYVLAAPREEAPLSAQSELLARYAAASGFSL
jgi:polyphosphate kinase